MTTAIPSWPFTDMPPLDPPAEYAELRSKCPVGKVRMWDGSEAWFAASYGAVKEVLASPAISADATRPGYPAPNETIGKRNAYQSSFVRMDEPEHSVHRRMLMPDFTLRRVKGMQSTIEGIVDELIADMGAGPNPTDLIRTFAQRVPAHVTCTLLGLPFELSDFFLTRIRTFTHLDSTVGETEAAFNEVLDYLAQLIDEKDADPGDDLVSRLVVEQLRPGDLTREELQQMLHLVLIGGFDTTANMIALGTIALLEHPDELERAISDSELWPSAVEELLRYLSVAGRTLVTRQTKAPMCLAGQDIGANESVVAPVMTANHDPEVYPNPENLDLGRNPHGHLAFGFGVHQCLGQQLARLELQVAFPRLFAAFPDLRLVRPKEELRYKNATVYGVQELPVAW
jgi:cytochrome P450